ncbi:MAG TPA: hypothetical protein VJI68_01440 [Candidatus Nanoarchaeia archaeon]|nr:hypothetical protein [Candidatus Nanoarchaeia archaeon]
MRRILGIGLSSLLYVLSSSANAKEPEINISEGLTGRCVGHYNLSFNSEKQEVDVIGYLICDTNNDYIVDQIRTTRKFLPCNTNIFTRSPSLVRDGCLPDNLTWDQAQKYFNARPKVVVRKDLPKCNYSEFDNDKKCA